MERVARWAVVAAGLAAVSRYLFIALSTIGYPFQLEWMEGGTVDVASRIANGDPIFVPPSIEYVPYVYPPLYFALVAATSGLIGQGLFAARLVSLVAIAGVCALIASTVRRETSSWMLAAGAVGLFVGGFELTGRWYHLARLDSTYLFFLLAALYALRFGRSWRSAAAAGALLWLAFMTKQTAVLVAAPLLIGTVWLDRRRAAVGAATFVVPTLLTWVGLGAATDGWFLYYTLELPAQHELALVDASHYLLAALPVALPSFAVALFALVLATRRDRRTGAFLVAAFVGLVPLSWLFFAHTGSHLNALMPAWAAVCLLAPLAVMHRPRGHRVRVAALFLTVQLVLLAEPVADSLPAAGEIARGERFVRWLRERDGEVLLPDMRYVQTLAGRPSHGLGVAARDVLRADRDDPGRRLLEESLANAISERRFGTIVLSQPDWLDGVVALRYRPAGTIDFAPRPVTGWPLTPTWVWERDDLD